MTVNLLPTLKGKVEGIVGWSPLQLQCHDCGSVYTGQNKYPATDVILSGYHFHTCDGPKGYRRCPDCLATSKRLCPKKT